MPEGGLRRRRHMKHEIAIVTDSSASLPQELIDKYDVTVIPMQIQFENEAYRDGIDITREEFSENLVDLLCRLHLNLPLPILSMPTKDCSSSSRQ